jgi:hypothetical protein
VSREINILRSFYLLLGSNLWPLAPSALYLTTRSPDLTTSRITARELKYREALLLPRHVEFWTSGAPSDRGYFSDKQKRSGCPRVIV